MADLQVSFFQHFATLPVIATGAGRDYIGPDMFATQMAGNDMVNCEAEGMLPAVLTGIIISAEDFPPGEFDDHPR